MRAPLLVLATCAFLLACDAEPDPPDATTTDQEQLRVDTIPASDAAGDTTELAPRSESPDS